MEGRRRNTLRIAKAMRIGEVGKDYWAQGPGRRSLVYRHLTCPSWLGGNFLFMGFCTTYWKLWEEIQTCWFSITSILSFNNSRTLRLLMIYALSPDSFTQLSRLITPFLIDSYFLVFCRSDIPRSMIMITVSTLDWNLENLGCDFLILVLSS